MFIWAVSFNSQRDGILPRSIRQRCLSPLFQFPTGWNSTKGFQYVKTNSVVSIPNGMEFYIVYVLRETAVSPFQFPTGWNSTQILGFSLFRCLVSIPNGMEFYALDKNSADSNSAFQFPTGWNSTEGLYDSIKDHLSFQFPTGWNSTH